MRASRPVRRVPRPASGPVLCERDMWAWGERRVWGTCSVSVSVETRRSDDLYTGASPDGDGVEAERWPLLGGDGGRKEMGRGRLEVLVDNAWRTHVGRRGGEGCYDTYRSVLYRGWSGRNWRGVSGFYISRSTRSPCAPFNL